MQHIDDINNQLQRIARHLGNGWRADTIVRQDINELFNPLQGFRVLVSLSYKQKGKITLSPKTRTRGESISLNWQRSPAALAADIKRRLIPQLPSLKQKDDEHSAAERARAEALELLTSMARRIHHRLTPSFRTRNESYSRTLEGGGLELNIAKDCINFKATLNPDLALRILAILAEEDRKQSKMFKVVLHDDREEKTLQPFIWQNWAYSKEDALQQARSVAHNINRAYFYTTTKTIQEIAQ